MSYRNKLLFIVIVAVAIIASVIIAISWMNSNEDIKRLRETYGLYAYGQSSSLYSNCILLMMESSAAL